MNIILFLKGLFIGSTMTIPGVSGGTMAIILGVYEDLIHNVNQIKKEPFKKCTFSLQHRTGRAYWVRCICKGYILSSRKSCNWYLCQSYICHHRLMWYSVIS